jgi:hypothetical protein
LCLIVGAVVFVGHDDLSLCKRSQLSFICLFKLIYSFIEILVNELLHCRVLVLSAAIFGLGTEFPLQIFNQVEVARTILSNKRVILGKEIHGA